MIFKPNTMLLVAVSIAAMLLLASASFFGKPDNDDMLLKSGLDGDQIRHEGMQLYIGNCMRCHGVQARGSSFGPPLVHSHYIRANMSDQSFAQAVLYGVKARYWDYGDMKPVEGLKQTQIAMILAYVRALQSEAGLR